MGKEKNSPDIENGKNSRKMMAALCIAILILLIAIIVLLLTRKEGASERSETEPVRRNIVVNEQNAEEAAVEMASVEFVEPGYYTVNMATEWHFSQGDAVSKDARVDNVMGNTNPVYFDVFIQGDEEEPIYSSPVIPMGSFLEGIALDKDLDAGAYDCVMIYHLVDEEQNTISTLRVAIQIIVES